MANTIYAAFNDSALAEKAVGALLDHGVRSEDISLVRSHDGEVTGIPDAVNYRPESISRERAAEAVTQWDDAVDQDHTGMSTRATIDNPGGYSGGQVLNDLSATDPNAGYGDTTERVDTFDRRVYDVDDRDPNDDIEKSAKQGISTTTGADAGAGAVKGAGIGLGLGILAGLASMFVPGVGLVVGGGALAAAIGGAAATTGAGAVAGAVTGYLKDQGVDTQLASDYDQAVQNGGALLAINVPSGDIDETRVREVLSKYGATNVNAYATRGYMA